MPFCEMFYHSFDKFQIKIVEKATSTYFISILPSHANGVLKFYSFKIKYIDRALSLQKEFVEEIKVNS